MSRAVRRLERELGMALLRRTEAAVVEVLPAGKRLFIAAQRILAEGQELLEDLATEARDVRGLLQIAAIQAGQAWALALCRREWLPKWRMWSSCR